ncbi:MAG: hypothetical protein OHK0053_01910 [Microscillaceae bacterium]
MDIQDLAFQEGDIFVRKADLSRLQNGSESSRFYSRALAITQTLFRWQEGQTAEDWADKTLQQLIPFVGGVQATLYLADAEARKLAFLSGFAIDYLSNLPRTFVFGEGLIGQVALNREPLFLENDQDFVSITSLQKIRLRSSLLLPLLHQDQTVAVMEVCFPKIVPENHRLFLMQMAEAMGTHLFGLKQASQQQEALKNLQQKAESWQKMDEASSEGLVFINAQGHIVEFNRAFQKLFGYENEEIAGLPLQQFVPDWEQEVNPYGTLGKHKDGKDFFVEVSRKELQSSEASFWALGIRDISFQKQATNPPSIQQGGLDEARKILDLSQALKKKNKDLLTSLHYAQRIQEALLPEPRHLQSLLPDMFVYYKPREVVSGDFYWWGVEGQRVVLAAVDATGHGVPGAIMTLAGTLYFNQIVHLQKITAPDEILTQLHLNIFEALKQEESQNREGMDAGICTIDFQHRQVEFAGAKNGLLFFQNGQCFEEAGDPLSAGGFWSRNEGHRIFHKKKIPFGAGKTMFYLFTDGYEDQFGGPRGRKFMKQNLRDLFQEIHTEPMEEQKAILASTMEVWMKGQRQIDDMLVLGFRI